jgi:hypothetical protein
MFPHRLKYTFASFEVGGVSVVMDAVCSPLREVRS